MNSTEDLFQESIAQYKTLISDASQLSSVIPTLSPDEILQKCTKLNKRHSEQAKIDKFITEIMLDYGPQILDHSYVIEYQKILTRAANCYDEVFVQTQAVRSALCHCHDAK